MNIFTVKRICDIMLIQLDLQQYKTQLQKIKQNKMRKLLVLIISLSGYTVHAQWRLQLQSGISNSLSSVKKDSVFAAQASGVHAQARATYFWGHMGLGAAVGYLQRNVRRDANLNAPPSILRGVDTFSINAGGVKAIYVLAGPEFCIACGDKIKFNIGVRAGVSILQNKLFEIKRQGALQYKNEIASKAPFTFNVGVGAHYFTSTHLGFGAMLDYHRFVVKANNNDFRRGITNTVLLKHANNILNAGVSVLYKF